MPKPSKFEPDVTLFPSERKREDAGGSGRSLPVCVRVCALADRARDAQRRAFLLDSPKLYANRRDVFRNKWWGLGFGFEPGHACKQSSCTTWDHACLPSCADVPTQPAHCMCFLLQGKSHVAASDAEATALCMRDVQMYVHVCMYVLYIYIYMYTHTHTYIYIYLRRGGLWLRAQARDLHEGFL